MKGALSMRCSPAFLLHVSLLKQPSHLSIQLHYTVHVLMAKFIRGTSRVSSFVSGQ